MNIYNILRKSFIIAILVTASTHLFAGEANELVLDNGQPGTSSSHTWKVSWGANPHGDDSLYARVSGARYTFKVNLASPGEYKVFVRWTKRSSRSEHAPYDISHSNGIDTVEVNQKQNEGQWQQLGSTWNFESTAKVTLRTVGDGTTVNADAIKLVPVTRSSETSYPESGATENEESNTPPTITGTSAAQIVAGSNYSFEPTAFDPDYDPLTFSISNRPTWASFNNSTGELSGTPTENDIGSTSNITISVYDGISTVSLPAFNVTVTGTGNSAQTGVVNLKWTAPVARTDGSALSLSEITGYTIHYGTSKGTYPQSHTINNGSATSATISNLPVGTYYMVVTTQDTGGRNSGFSTSIAKHTQ